jgi:rhamnulokinase
VSAHSTSVRYAGIDLGASSGRVAVGAFDGKRLTLDEVHRFSNDPVRVGDRLHWDILRLLHEIRTGLRRAGTVAGGELRSFAIDSWAVDFGLLGRDGDLLGNPRHYRDHAWPAAVDAVHARIPFADLFRRTGIQHLPFNTIYQLAALANESGRPLDRADALLLIPDLLLAMLTGVRVQEATNASTTGCVAAGTGTWDTELLSRLGIPSHLFGPLTQPPALIGGLDRASRDDTGLGPVPGAVVASHDTASAFVAVPAGTEPFVVVSCGTWSLLGTETPAPVLSDAARERNFSNESGAFGTTRLLKNIMGLWLAESCRREWARTGEETDHAVLIARAEAASPLRTLIDPDHPSFLAPDQMQVAIRDRCAATGQPVPEDAGAMLRCVYESLALRYRQVLGELEDVTGHRYEALHIVGGGSRNRLLCQLTADAIGRPVVSGPAEATTIGNVALQAVAAGDLAGLTDARDVIRRSFPVDTYAPRPDPAWADAWDRFGRLSD